GNGIDDDKNGYIDDYMGWDFGNYDNDPIDKHGHGTHVAGIIGTITDNSLGVSGVVPANIKLMPVKIFSSGFGGSIDSIPSAIKYAVDNGAKILSNSWGFISPGFYPGIVKEAVQYATDKGCVVIFAAGNEYSGKRYYPGADENVVGVGATDSTDSKASFSNYGSWVDVSAPGVDILSLRAENTDMYAPREPNVHIVPQTKDAHGKYVGKYYLADGTSMAAPHVSGVAALILLKHPEFTNKEVKAILKSTGDIPNSNKYIGTGRINAHKSLTVDSIPISEIYYPDDDTVSGEIEIIGTANGRNGIKMYKIEYGVGIYPTKWKEIFSSTIPVDNGKLGALDTNVLPEQEYTLRLSVSDGVHESIDMKIIRVIHGLHKGWPQQLLGGQLDTIFSSVAVDDLDNDGNKEVVSASLLGIYVWDSNGNPKTGWPVRFDLFSGELIFTTPAIGDVDSDGDKEIVVSTLYSIYVFNHDGSVLHNWKISDLVRSSPALGDLDNDDDMEIIIVTATSSDISPPYYDRIYLSIYHHDGSNFAGWPKEFHNGVYMEESNVGIHTPAIADIDGDGRLEVIESNPIDNEVYVWHSNGELVIGWPQKVIGPSLPQQFLWFGECRGIAIGDIDIDGDMEIVTSTGEYVYAWHHDGTSVVGWPQQSNALSSPVLADVDNDGDLEILAGPNNFGGAVRVYGWHHTGTYISSWPIIVSSNLASVGIYTSVSIGDIDGDNEMDVVVVNPGYRDHEPNIFAYNWKSELLRNWPKFLGTEIISTPTLSDVDGDGSIEIIFATFDDNKVYIFDVAGKVNKRNPQWGMFCHDLKHTSTIEIETAERRIEIKEGWSFISFDIMPIKPNVEDVLKDIIDDVVYMYTFTERVLKEFRPGSPTNTLTELKPYYAYGVYMTKSATLVIEGEEVPDDTPIKLVKGENYVSYLPNSPMEIKTALESIWGYIAYITYYVQTEEGWLLYPVVQPDKPETTWDFNEMKPGQGYSINVNSDCILVYPYIKTLINGADANFNFTEPFNRTGRVEGGISDWFISVFGNSKSKETLRTQIMGTIVYEFKEYWSAPVTETRPLKGIGIELFKLNENSNRYDKIAENCTDLNGKFTFKNVYDGDVIYLRLYLGDCYKGKSRVVVLDNNIKSFLTTPIIWDKIHSGNRVKYIVIDETFGTFYDGANVYDTMWRAHEFVKKAGMDIDKTFVYLGDYTESFVRSPEHWIYIDNSPVDRDSWNRDTILHEYGHLVAYDGGFWVDAGGPHVINQHSDKSLAWEDGFSNFFQAVAQGKENGILVWRWYSVDGLEVKTIKFDFENWKGINDGLPDDDIDASVAGILWDLYDKNDNKEKEDKLSYSFKEILNVLIKEKPKQISNFKAAWLKYHPTDKEKLEKIYELNIKF
ncbi:MAG: S8 family serine peptidase, partial [Candidatus Thermoplasmatota archaeon]